MPATTAELVELLSLEEIEQRLYRGPQPQSLLQRTFGGQVLAQALIAAYGTVDEDRICHSLNAYFLRPGRNDAPIIYDVENLRDGNTFSSRRVLARQGGRPIFTMNCSFHVLEPGLEHSDEMQRGLPAPETCPNLHEVMEARFGQRSQMWHEWDALDVRLIPVSEPGANMKVWVKSAEELPDDFRIHQAVTAYMSDMTLLSVSTIPHKVVFLSPQVQAASIDHAMWFHRPMRADQWMLYDQDSPSASHALGYATGRLMQGGARVASCSQEGLIRVVEGGATY